MTNEFTRRTLIQAGVAVSAASAQVTIPGPRPESMATPKICLETGAGSLSAGTVDEAGMRKIKQLGIDHVLTGGPRAPWTEAQLKGIMDNLKSGGLTLGNLMIGGLNNTILGRPGRDEEIENVQKSIRAAGKVGLPVIEYNFYVHRAMEGYYEEKGRAGSGRTAFDYEKMRDLPALPNVGVHDAEEIWANMTYFLKAVIPVAESAGVRLALHPGDPPAPISRGSKQIMGSVAGWKRLVDIVKSPSNGITFDCGVSREMGEDPVEVCRYFASRDCINHVHFRNVIVTKPYEKYAEVFIDEGEINMFLVMKELVKNKYSHLIYPEHPRGIDYDKERAGFRTMYPGGGGYAGFAFNVGFARAMLQAALT